MESQPSNLSQEASTLSLISNESGELLTDDRSTLEIPSLPNEDSCSYVSASTVLTLVLDGAAGEQSSQLDLQEDGSQAKSLHADDDAVVRKGISSGICVFFLPN